MITKICETCSQVFNVEDRRKKSARYCSRRCRFTGTNIPCCNCGITVYRPAYKIALYKVVYCSVRCESTYRKTNFSGINHPRYKISSSLPDLTKEQKEIVLGTVLGDGCLLLNSKGNAHLQVAHSVKQRAYLDYKHMLLTPFSRPININRRFDPRYSRIYETHRFHTVCHPYFSALRESLYVDGKKTLTQYVDKNFTPRVLAFWFMDDGSSMQGSTLTICTVSFAQADIRRIAELISSWGVKSWERAGRLIMSQKSKSRFLELCGDFIPESMQYKL